MIIKCLLGGRKKEECLSSPSSDVWVFSFTFVVAKDEFIVSWMLMGLEGGFCQLVSQVFLVILLFPDDFHLKECQQVVYSNHFLPFPLNSPHLKFTSPNLKKIPKNWMNLRVILQGNRLKPNWDLPDIDIFPDDLHENFWKMQ